jgi:enoyl-CoA hydratase/carnithine racemase
MVSYRIDSGLAIISLERANDGNRLDGAMLAELEGFLERSGADPQVRAIALRSLATAGEPFCHGMNLDVLSASLNASTDKRAREDAVASYSRVLETVAFGSKPTIALVNGSVKAGGVGLVAACDFVLATNAASFELTEVFFGLIPANVLPYLTAFRVSPARAKSWTLSALPWSTTVATREGLVDMAIADGEAETTLRSLCKQLWRAEPGAIAAAKRFFRDAQALNGSDLRNYARGALLERLETPAVAQAMSSLREGGSPPWFGKFKPSQPVW